MRLIFNGGYLGRESLFRKMDDSSDKFHNPKQVTKPSYLMWNSCTILICYERFGFFDEIIPIQNLVKTMKDVMAMKAAMTMKAVFRLFKQPLPSFLKVSVK